MHVKHTMTWTQIKTLLLRRHYFFLKGNCVELYTSFYFKIKQSAANIEMYPNHQPESFSLISCHSISPLTIWGTFWFCLLTYFWSFFQTWSFPIYSSAAPTKYLTKCWLLSQIHLRMVQNIQIPIIVSRSKFQYTNLISHKS